MKIPNIRLQEISLTYNLKTKGFVKRLGIQSVSYTHLDVYKRQQCFLYGLNRC